MQLPFWVRTRARLLLSLPTNRPPCTPALPTPLGAARLEEASPHGEDQFQVAARTRVVMKAGGADAPYQQQQGDFTARFSLVYASLDDLLPLVGAGLALPPVALPWLSGCRG